MLAYILATALGLAPALQEVLDLPLQLALQRALLLGFLAWAWLRLRESGRGQAAAARRPALWAAGALSLLSLLASPLRGWTFNEWGNFACGLLVFAWASSLNKEERGRVEGAVRAGAWLVFALCLLQAFVLRNFHDRPPLTNLNALALYAVMILPLGLERRATWALSAAMLVLVIWTQSIGAALAGLAAAGAYAAHRRAGAVKGNLLPFAALALIAAGALWALQGESVAGRLAWWRGAWEMFLERPLAGFGHAAYGWAHQLFVEAGAFRERSSYAHNYYLEYLAENGLPGALCWFWFLWRAVKARTGLAKYAVIAALAHSLVDFGLNVPANFWLFCFLLAEPAGEESEAAPAARYKIPALAAPLAGLLLAALLALDLRTISFERAAGRASAAAARGAITEAEAALAPWLSPGLFRGRALETLGRMSLSDVELAPGLRAAAWYEQALIENPYSPTAWEGLRRVYSLPGLEAAAVDLERRRKEALR